MTNEIVFQVSFLILFVFFDVDGLVAFADYGDCFQWYAHEKCKETSAIAIPTSLFKVKEPNNEISQHKYDWIPNQNIPHKVQQVQIKFLRSIP